MYVNCMFTTHDTRFIPGVATFFKKRREEVYIYSVLNREPSCEVTKMSTFYTNGRKFKSHIGVNICSESNLCAFEN